MSNASDGARIKVWPGSYTPFQPTLNGGGSSGYVKNVTYDTMYNSNNDWAIELTQCYGQSNQTLCSKYPVRKYSDALFDQPSPSLSPAVPLLLSLSFSTFFSGRLTLYSVQHDNLGCGVQELLGHCL